MLKMKKNKKGFTLIELVVVIAILGILAAIAIPRFSNITDNAKVKANESEHRIIVSAVQMYRAASPTMAVPTSTTISGLDDYIEGGLASLHADGTPAGTTYVNANGKHEITFGDGTITITSTPNIEETEGKVSTTTITQ